MTRFKDFGEGENTTSEPLSFRLKGEEFFCVPQVPGKLLLELAKSGSSTDPAENAGIITKFFSQVLDDESTVRFDALLEDKNRVVTVETLAKITGWLVEQYTGERPEKLPEASSTGL